MQIDTLTNYISNYNIFKIIGNNFAGSATGITHGQDRGNWVCCIAHGPYGSSPTLPANVTTPADTTVQNTYAVSMGVTVYI